MYGTTTIRVDSRPYLFHFWGVVAVLGRPDRSSLAVDVLPFLKRPKPHKSSATAHARITKSLFQHFRSFTSPFYPISHSTWCTHFVRSTSAKPPKSENRRRLMQYTHKDTWNNQTLPHPTTPLGHTHSQDTTATHPSGKLVNYKRIACYEHCPGTFWIHPPILQFRMKTSSTVAVWVQVNCGRSLTRNITQDPVLIQFDLLMMSTVLLENM